MIIYLRNVLRSNNNLEQRREITMSYESRFIFAIVPQFNVNFKSDKKKWCRHFAEFKLSKFNGSPKCFDKESEYFFYGYDGNTQVLKDFYDEPLTQCTFKKFVEWINQDIETLEDEVNFEIGNDNLFMSLKTYTNSLKYLCDTEEIIVLHFGC